jgi:tRNA(Ser,Leu) C12 N-acetylase TAN1
MSAPASPASGHPARQRSTSVKDWNVVVTIFQDGFRRARRALQELGTVDASPYYNVLLMKVEDPLAALEAIEKKTEQSPALYDAISRTAPAMRCFEFESTEDFQDKAKSVLRDWSPRLAGRSFHARLHRRGAHHHLTTPDVERFLNDTALAVTQEVGEPAKLSFADPDAVIVVDTVDDRAGIALWTRDDLAKHRLLRPD